MQLQAEYQQFISNESDNTIDDCNMCGGSGYLDLEQMHECPDCQGLGQAGERCAQLYQCW
jgi:DnaJ-class molecular chaperone